jgi:hypothetical protein
MFQFHFADGVLPFVMLVEHKSHMKWLHQSDHLAQELG